MEAFGDAVFAIAFTIPVVEVVIPHADKFYGAKLLNYGQPILDIASRRW